MSAKPDAGSRMIDRSTLDRATSLYEQASAARQAAIRLAQSAFETEAGRDENPDRSARTVDSMSANIGMDDLVVRAERLVTRVRSALEASALANVLNGSSLGYGDGPAANAVNAAKAIADAEVAAIEAQSALVDLGGVLLERGDVETARRIFAALASEAGGPAVRTEALKQLSSIDTDQLVALCQHGDLAEASLRLNAAPNHISNIDSSTVKVMVDAVLARKDLSLLAGLYRLLSITGAANPPQRQLLLAGLAGVVGGVAWEPGFALDLPFNDNASNEWNGAGRSGSCYGTALVVSRPVFSNDGQLVAMSYVFKMQLLTDSYVEWGGVVVEASAGQVLYRFGKLEKKFGVQLVTPLVHFLDSANQVIMNAGDIGCVAINLPTGSVVRHADRYDIRVAAAEAALGDAVLSVARKISTSGASSGLDGAGARLGIVEVGDELVGIGSLSPSHRWTLGLRIAKASRSRSAAG